ncbi:MAG TPA: hypothetical protein VN579_07560 [Bryobacteraceae bacterium]|nr:hypothetical protein [Bryobacteraceae bacterium]
MAKIHWDCAPTVSDDGRRANARIIEALGLQKHRGAGRLAIVGGGPSIREHVEELRAWDGAVWAVNGAINWCIDHGVEAWFYTADASPLANWTYDLSRVQRAVLAPDCSPELVAILRATGVLVSLSGLPQSGPTSVNASDFLALEAGYQHITYFGCEGSFSEDGTHAFRSFPVTDWMDIDTPGGRFRTKAEFISQAIMLSNTINAFPDFYTEKSGGLLRAMVEHGHEYDVYAVSNELFAKLKDVA